MSFPIREYIFDAVGLAFTGAAIYVGVVKGVQTPDFEIFMTAAAVYLGIKAPVGSGTAAAK